MTGEEDENVRVTLLLVPMPKIKGDAPISVDATRKTKNKKGLGGNAGGLSKVDFRVSEVDSFCRGYPDEGSRLKPFYFVPVLGFFGISREEACPTSVQHCVAAKTLVLIISVIRVVRGRAFITDSKENSAIAEEHVTRDPLLPFI